MTDNTPNSDEIPYGYCHCGCGQKTKISPRNHTATGRIKGEPYRFIAQHHRRLPSPVPIEERFWDKVDKRGPDECWEWQASCYTAGYGQFWTGAEVVGAHRFVYSLANGSIPDGMNVCHTCDNPPCCNPDHLFVGDDSANVQDMIEKGRNNPLTGDRNAFARFTNKQVREFREQFAGLDMSMRAFARMRGVDAQTMRMILKRITYKDA